jgi:thioesterase domain-containing protein
VLLQVRPTGPYILAGWCNTGVVALEVARRLVARGKSVPLIVLLDSWNPAFARKIRSRADLPLKLRIRIHKLRWHARKFLGLGLKNGLLRVANGIRTRVIKLASAFSAIRRTDADNANEVTLTGRLITNNYVPEPSQSNILLITSEPLGSCKPIMLQGWDGVARKRFDVFHLTCEHTEIFLDPYAEQLARSIAKSISAVKSDSERLVSDPIPPSPTGKIISPLSHRSAESLDWSEVNQSDHNSDSGVLEPVSP